MALRVLLADESTTIKRVMQLALQDFAVEVKAVPVGVDVLPVTKGFRPDIIFVDVLLPKKSGYEVSRDLKKDPETRNIPLILMWSGFMELDETKARESQADRRLEKPFEPETLRSLIQEFVKKTNDNPVSAHLKFPPLPDFQEDSPGKTSELPKPPPPKPEVSNLTSSHIFSIEASKEHIPDELSTPDLPEEEEFAQVPLHHQATLPPIPPPSTIAHEPQPQTGSRDSKSANDEEWSHQDLSKFKIKIPETEKLGDDFAQKYMIPADELEKPEVSNHGDFEEVIFNKSTHPPSSEDFDTITPVRKVLPTSASGTLNHEQIIREEARQIIESIVWKILPEITERIVREEINKLLQDTEKSISVP